MRFEFVGQVDQRDSKQHILHQFTLPEGVTKLTIRFAYKPRIATGQILSNDLSLTVFDPQGARGARHNNLVQNLTITASDATPGYLPGAIQPGEWTVCIDTHRILPPDAVEYRLDIETSGEPIARPDQPWSRGAVAPRGPGWYRGDLHGHTIHSDGAWDVPDLVQYGRDYQLDFVTLSDHNTVSGLAQMDSLTTDGLLTMGGVELTTYYGHALALGLRRWVDWRVQPDQRTMPMIADEVRQAGGLFIIAHPMSIGDPECTGCNWDYPDMMPGNARCVEIWNGPWDGDSNNEAALELWHRWLNEGCRMVATAGSDIHRPMTDPHPGFDVVYAQELSEQAILNAVRQGHLYVSAGPRLELKAWGDAGDSVMMGDILDAETADVTLRWEGCAPSDRLRLVVNGQINETFNATERGQHSWRLPAEARWCTVEIRSAQGQPRALTNPIFIGANWRNA